MNDKVETLQRMKDALLQATMRMRLLSTHDLIKRAMQICEPVVPGSDMLVVDALMLRAGDGSIDAVAALVALYASERHIIDALKMLANRYPDIIEGLQIEALTAMFEEYAEDEIAAGRMTKARGPDGRWLYSMTGKRKRQ